MNWFRLSLGLVLAFVALFMFHQRGIVIDRHKLNDLGTEYIRRDTVRGVWTSGNSWFTNSDFVREYDRRFWHIDVIDTIAVGQ